MSSGGARFTGFWVALVAPAVLACSLVPTLGESPEEYQLYRNVHLAETLEERLASARQYLHEVPGGRRRDELRRWFTREEAAYFVRADDDLPRLRAYLAVLPDGPHAPDVVEKIRGIEVLRRQAARNAELQARSFAENEAHLQRAAEGRRQLLRTLRGWIERLGTVRSFGQPLAALEQPTTFALRVSEPRGVCTAEGCVKELDLPFEVPNTAGELLQRTAKVEVRFQLEGDKLVRASLRGPGLWARTGEALSLREAESREASSSLALVAALVEGALGESFAAPECEREPTPGIVFERKCEGVRITMRAGTGLEPDDSLEVESASARATPAEPQQRGGKPRPASAAPR